MNLNPRYDDDPEFFDDNGLICSKWLFMYYYKLNGLDKRTKEQDYELDMIFNASQKGKDALEEVEKIIKSKK